MDLQPGRVPGDPANSLLGAMILMRVPADSVAGRASYSVEARGWLAS